MKQEATKEAKDAKGKGKHGWKRKSAARRCAGAKCEGVTNDRSASTSEILSRADERTTSCGR